MKYLSLLLLVLASYTGKAQHATANDITGMWHLDKMTQNNVCVFDQNDSMVLIKSVFDYAKRMNQKLTHADSLKILGQCHNKASDMRHVFVQFLKDGTSRNRHLKPEGGVTDTIQQGTWVFDKKAQTIEYSGLPKMGVRVSRNRLYLSFVVGLTLKPQEVIMEYVR